MGSAHSHTFIIIIILIICPSPSASQTNDEEGTKKTTLSFPPDSFVLCHHFRPETQSFRTVKQIAGDGMMEFDPIKLL